MKSMIFFLAIANFAFSELVLAETLFIRCRALSANGSLITGDMEPVVNNNIQASAEQAWRNFMYTRCGGPLGGVCAPPTKCDGYDRSLNNQGQVLEK